MSPLNHHSPAPLATPQRIPRATYRLQFHGGFTLRQAIDLAPYLAELGVSHLYASPLLTARPGSTHGYDQCDCTQLNREIGTEAELEELAALLRRHQMGLVLDIVPNHMGIGGPENAWWWDVLTYGSSSRFAHYFDIDWNSPNPRLKGKVLVPVLGAPYEQVLKAGELKLAWEEGSPRLRYYEQTFPLAPASHPAGGEWSEAAVAEINASPETLDAVLQQQHYRLAWWREGDTDLNYRRFFSITSLAGVRVEDPQVFHETHQKILDWRERGWIDGLRIDHPDGLRDPLQYLERLRAAAPGAWIVVEKILVGGESLPPDWPVSGTTGYDFIRQLDGLFIDPSAEKPLTEFYAEFTGESTAYAPLVRDAKRLVLKQLFVAEINRLTGLLLGLAGHQQKLKDFNRAQIQEALLELAACFPVYRTYAQAGRDELSKTDAGYIDQAIATARQHRTDLPPGLFDFLRDLLLRRLRGPGEDEFTLRFQQLTGAVMAKGVEDTAFYQFNRLVALNEVGGDPSRFGSSPQEFHRACQWTGRHWPHTMLASTTHDTKRGEDVRARLSLLSEIPQPWIEAVRRWSTLNQRHHQDGWPDRNAEYLFYQTLVGAWPLEADRAVAYLQKASREAKQHTDWIEPKAAYDQALRHFVHATLSDPAFLAELESFARPLVEWGRINSLAQTLLKLTAPGVPDLYQGAEFWDLSLVDPDNRRPVDFAARRASLDALRRQFSVSVKPATQMRALYEQAERAKQFLVWRTLQFRRVHAELFAQGQYIPLTALGAKANHVVAFARAHQNRLVVIVVPRLLVSLMGGAATLPLGSTVWQDTRIELRNEDLPGEWENVFTQERMGPLAQHQPPTLSLSEILRHFPVALLAPADRLQSGECALRSQ